MDRNKALEQIFNKNNNMGLIVKCLIIKPDKTEIWIKKEGEDINDYDVLDKLIDGKYNFEDIFVAYI